MTEMTSLERCLIILDGGVPDRVAVCLENFMHAARVGGYTVEEYATEGEKMASAQLATLELFGHDMIDLENGVCALAGAVGCEVEFYGDGASPPWVSSPAVSSLEEVYDLPQIDPTTDGTLPEVLKATRLLADEVGDTVCILAEADQGPFSLAAQIIDPQEFLVALLDPDAEEHVKALMDYCSEQVVRYASALIDAGAHLTMMGESISGPDVCSPRVYRKFAKQYQSRVVGELASEGKRLGMHICGNATGIIEDMVDTGAAFLQVDHKIDLETAKEAARGKTTLIGTVDPSAVLALGTVDDVVAMARTNIDALAEGGGFVLSPGCVLPYTTPDENVHALIETAHSYGSYGS